MKKTLQITWRGSENCFQKCSFMICQRLIEEKFQWKRSDKEFPQQIQLFVEFIEFSTNSIRNSNISTYPPKQIPAVCHLFFLDFSDLEQYKIDVRSKLAEWFSVLRDADTNDWLIVFDSTKAREAKNKNSILEKLRSDFSKHTSRIIEIFSVQTKGAPILIRTMVETITFSLDLLVQNYESALKIERDNCFHVQWMFNPYFINQLQLAQIYFSLGLFDSSLAQLEEVDALLSLLLTQFASNLLKPKWVVDVFKTSPILSIRDCLEKINFFDFDRSELNHCRIRLLLVCYQICVVKRRLEANSGHLTDLSKVQTAEIILNYGFKMLKHYREEKGLLNFHQNSDPCQSFSRVLWCVELLNLAEDFCEIGRITSAAESVSNIWIIICREIETVRKALEDQTVSLANLENQFKKFLPEDFQDCLTSFVNFDAQYVKWHETAIAILKHMNWNRNAKLICLALARFHSSRRNSTGTVQFYSKLLKYLRNDRWFDLYFSLLSEIDEYRREFSKYDRLIFAADQACRRNFTDESRKLACFEEFLDLLSSPCDEEEKIQLNVGSSWIKLVKNVTVSSAEISRGMKFRWNFRILSEFPRNLEKINTSLCYSSYESEIDMHRQKTNSPILSTNSERDGDLISTNSFRMNYHKRISDVIDRNQCNSSKKSVVLNFDTLKPGENEFFVEIDPNSCGIYRPDHLHFCTDSLSMILPIDQSSLSHCFVENFHSVLVLNSKQEILWAGVTQTLNLFIRMGSEFVSRESETFSVLLSSVDNEICFPEDDKNFFQRKLPVPFLDVNQEYSVSIPVFVGLNGQQADRSCRISIIWFEKIYEFDFVFKSLLAWTFHTHVVGTKFLVEFVLTNFSRRILNVESADLELFLKENTPKLNAKLLNNIKLDLAPECPQSIVWEMSSGEYYREGLVSFTYCFGGDFEKFECWAKLVFSELLTVEACCQVASESAVCRVDWPCDFVISLKADHKSLRSAELSVLVLADDKFWRCLESSAVEVTLKENGLGQTSFRLTPQCVGYLPLPSVDVRVVSPAGTACQVYVRSKGKQIHVLSAVTRSKIENKSKIAQLTQN